MPEQGMQASSNSNRRGSSRYEMDSYGTAYYEDDDYYGQVVMETPAKTNRPKPSKAAANGTGAKKTEKRPEKKTEKSPAKKTENKKPEAKKKQSPAGKKKKPQQSASAKTSQGRTNKAYDYYEEDYEQEVVNRQNVRKGGYVYDDYEYPENLGKNEYDYNPKAEGFKTVLTVIAAVIIGCILLYFAGQATGIFEQIGNASTQSPDTGDDAERAVMPEFEGHDLDEIKQSLNAVGLGCKTTFTESAQYAKNQVISAALEDGQKVLANDKILKNTTIILTVSAGGEGIPVPAVEGMSEAEGTAALTKEGFKVIKTEQSSAEYAKGTIISQSPEGNSIAPIESEVTIVLSVGGDGAQARMPQVLGNSKDAAVSVLEAAGFVVNNIEESYSSDYPAGQICYQSYEAGTNVLVGAKVDLKVSIGSEIATYSCRLTVEAPEDYVGGPAEVHLMTADGSEVLWSAQNVTAFPVSININDLKVSSAYGTVIVTYLANKEVPIQDADGNQTTQVVPEPKNDSRSVQFTKN